MRRHHGSHDHPDSRPVDPEVPSLTAWELRGGRYEVAALVSGDEEWVASAPYDVRIVPAELYA